MKIMIKYLIKPNNFTTDELVKLLVSISCDEEEKNIEFENGEYHIDVDELLQLNLYITNTVGDDEYSKDEIPHWNRAPIYLNHLKNITLNGNGARIVIHGNSSNVIIQNCENVTVKNLTITTENPQIQTLKVIKKGDFYVDYKCQGETGKNPWCAIHFPVDKPQFCQRIQSPLHKLFKVKKTSENTIRAYMFSAKKFNVGDEYYIYNPRRDFVGIFVENSKNITLENVHQHFNYSLAFVAQNTEDITLDNVDFTPEKDRKVCSLADFVQLCMCRGKITIKNSRFCGAGDDCMNVHGFHFKIVEKQENQIIIRFMHSQSHGFNAFNIDDEIAFISPQTLLEKGRARVINSKLLNEYDIQLTLDNAENVKTGEFVENVTACPDVDFINNKIEHIVTRGLLITTRGKVNIENNHFGSMGMSGILLSDDADNWFESGMCLDVTIKNNTFDYCGENGVLIKPENTEYQGAVHRNINIVGNTFKKCEKVCFDIKDSENIKIQNNVIENCLEKLKTQNVTNLEKNF